MRFETDLFHEEFTVIVQQRRDGNSAVTILKTDDTEVAFGGLFARVTLRDLGICVIMDPDEGQWDDRDWARAQALTVLSQAGTGFLVELVKFQRELGRRAGRDQLKRDLKDLLGIE